LQLAQNERPGGQQKICTPIRTIIHYAKIKQKNSADFRDKTKITQIYESKQKMFYTTSKYLL
jgi:hypothetical protein